MRPAAEPLGGHEGRAGVTRGRAGASAGAGIGADDTRAAILAAVDFVIDNAVPLSAIALGVLVLVGLVVLGIAGLRLWRTIKRVKAKVTAASDLLMAEADRLQESLAHLPDRQAELQDAIASLQGRAAALQVLAASAGDAIQVLRAPLRFVGR